MKTFAYISSWTHGEKDSGIGIYEFDSENGNLVFLEKAESNDSFNATFFDQQKGLLYAMNETSVLPAPGRRSGGGGRVFVFKIDPETGHLSAIGRTPTLCANPTYMAVDRERKYAVVANHGGGAVVSKLVRDVNGTYRTILEQDDTCVELFSLNEDGTLGDLLDAVFQEPGVRRNSSVISRPHTAVSSPDGNLFAVCDKGNDTVRMYAIDREKNKLYLKSAPRRYPEDTKPRYCLYHPELPYFYHNCEHSMNFYALRYDDEGRLDLINKCSILPEDYVKRPGPQEQQGLCMHPNGRFLYDIVRNPDLVCVFRIDEADGAVTKIQSLPVDDKWPRGCAVSRDGCFLIVCGLQAGRIFVYSVGEDGRLTDTGISLEQCCAAYATFAAVD